MNYEKFFAWLNESQKTLVWQVLMDIQNDGAPDRIKRLQGQVQRYEKQIEFARERQKRYKKQIDDSKMLLEQISGHEDDVKDFVDMLENRINDYEVLFKEVEPFEAIQKKKRVEHIIEKIIKRTGFADKMIKNLQQKKEPAKKQENGFKMKQILGRETLLNAK